MTSQVARDPRGSGEGKRRKNNLGPLRRGIFGTEICALFRKFTGKRKRTPRKNRNKARSFCRRNPARLRTADVKIFLPRHHAGLHSKKNFSSILPGLPLHDSLGHGMGKTSVDTLCPTDGQIRTRFRSQKESAR